MSKGRHIPPKRKKVPRRCPQCGMPDPFATEQTMWCGSCTWTVER